MTTQTIMEGQVIEAGAADDLSDDRDQQRELFDLYDDMTEGDRAETWITVNRIPMDAEGNPLPNSKAIGHLFTAPLGTVSKVDILTRARKFIRTGHTSIMVRVTGTRKGHRGALFHKIFMVERENEQPDEKKDSGSTTELFKLIQENQRIADERNQQFQERLLSMQANALTVRAPVAPPVDPMETMVKMMGAMGAMMGAMMNGRPMGAPAVAPPDPMDQMTKMFVVMQKFNGMMNGEPMEEESESIGSIVKTVAGVVGPALQLFAANKQAEVARLAHTPRRIAARAQDQATAATPPPAATASPAANADPITPPQENQLTEAQKMELDQLRKQLGTVCDLAESGKKAEDVAKLVLKTLPQEQDDQFFELISDDSFVDNCALLEDRVTKNRAFFEALRAALLAEYEPDVPA